MKQCLIFIDTFISDNRDNKNLHRLLYILLKNHEIMRLAIEIDNERQKLNYLKKLRKKLLTFRSH